MCRPPVGHHWQVETYRERLTPVPGAVMWKRDVAPGAERTLILPDGCMDLIWDGCRLFVAGPDSTARWHESPAGATYTGLRFSGGLGPALIGTPADELVDVAPDLAGIWPLRAAAELADHVAASPAAAFERWMLERYRSAPVDPLGRRILAMSEEGLAASVIAECVSLSVRQLHRRCLALFGYGPRRLGRVLRLSRALDAARLGAPLADIAAGCGYVDQAHLCRETRDLAGTTPAMLLRHLGIRKQRE
jgi:AraC-like DNA-binding protein